MRWTPFALRLSAGAVSLLVTALLVLSIMPFISGDLEIGMSEDGPDIHFQDGILTMSYPFEMYLNGVFDINDVIVSITMEDGEKKWTSSTEPMNIRGGALSRLDPTFTFDMSDMGQGKLASMVFEGYEVDVSFDLQGRYTLGLIGASIGFSDKMKWDPLIEDLWMEVDDDLSGPVGDDMYDLVVGYGFMASSLLQGIEMELNLTISGEGGELGWADEPITLDHLNSGDLRISLPYDSIGSDPQELTFALEVSVWGVKLKAYEGHYIWEGIP